MADEGPSTSAAPSELNTADEKFNLAKSLRTSDPEKAIALFGEALELRVKNHGDMSIHCASAYLEYGLALFNAAENNRDVFGEELQQAAEKHERPSSASKAPKTTPTLLEADDREDDEEEQDEDADDDDAEADEKGEEAPADDMGLAWEMLEMARMIYEQNGPEAHMDELAEIHLTLGNIMGEMEDFKGAIKEYHLCQSCLSKLEACDQRRVAEVCFKKAVVLQMVDQPEEALSCCSTAVRVLKERIQQLEEQADRAAEQEAAAAAAAAEGGAAAADKPARSVAQLEQDVSDLKASIEDLEIQAEELRQVIQSRASMKHALVSAMRLAGMVTAAAPAASTGFGASTSAAAAAEPTAAAAAAPKPVQDLGTVGRGKNRITPTCVRPAGDAAAKPAAGGAAAAAAAPKRSLDDLMGGGVPGGITSIGFGAAAGAAAAGGVTMIGFGAAAKADSKEGAKENQQPVSAAAASTAEPLAKKAKQEEAAAAPPAEQ